MRRKLTPWLIAALTATGFGLVHATAAGAAETGPADYVSLGSSFAAGPGIPDLQPGSPSACGRSTNNYASVLARDRGLGHTDASCSGATTANVVTTGQAGQPPQVDAVTADTTLVTVTIGGNDVNYLGSINTYSCQTSGGSDCGSVDTAAIDQAFGELPGRMRDVVNRIREKAPSARILVVSYFSLLPPSGACDGVPLTDDQLGYEHSIADRLATVTADAAGATGAELVDLAGASRDHSACAAEPWVEKYTAPAGRVTYHPNEAGMLGAAQLIESVL
ncbi:SGNH/GDSL hydrolase family protein [Amycolatopsis jiangsuensis]|uniref:Lysophospholipase L1-like esterase n=1 Tax=Amycolatopsis jiangsuensis TaxID=1181879 RepID=A0A840J6Z6_9PSEU|nr:SGNH/GDSL hydrolase family protein [Amycolatopsis jiangsuensis]MBB4689184.1 lysophospholipase L1-like esterase [Amycolatopsis jiangsuensis]